MFTSNVCRGSWEIAMAVLISPIHVLCVCRARACQGYVVCFWHSVLCQVVGQAAEGQQR